MDDACRDHFPSLHGCTQSESRSRRTAQALTRLSLIATPPVPPPLAIRTLHLFPNAAATILPWLSHFSLSTTPADSFHFNPRVDRSGPSRQRPLLVSVAAAAAAVPCRCCPFPHRCRCLLRNRLRLSRRRFPTQHTLLMQLLLLLPRLWRPTLRLQRRQHRMEASACSWQHPRHLPLRWLRPSQQARPLLEC